MDPCCSLEEMRRTWMMIGTRTRWMREKVQKEEGSKDWMENSGERVMTLMVTEDKKVWIRKQEERTPSPNQG